MRFDVITLFPEMFGALTEHGVTSRAKERNLFHLQLWNPRDYSSDTYRNVDDRPYGGGPGMLMQAEPMAKTTEAIMSEHPANTKIILPSPTGTPITQQQINSWMSGSAHWIIVCGRYEGIDQRYIDRYVDAEVSIGDIVVSGGELPAMLLMDATIRQIPEALGHERSAQEDSFMDGLLDCNHYTRPEDWRGEKVPEVLLSGNHARIAQWRQQQRLTLTEERRPDLYQAYQQDSDLSSTQVK